MKNGKFSFFLFQWILLFIIIVSIGCFKRLPEKTVVFEKNFEDSKRTGISIFNHSGRVDSPMVFLFNGSVVMGRFNNNLVSFAVDSLPDHNAVRIQFDLFIHDRWEGNHLDPITKIPDVWQLKLDQVPIMIRTFSNTTFPQSFPADYNPGVSQNPPYSDAWALLPGACVWGDKPDGTSLYKIDYITAHTANKVSLDINDALQPFNQPCNKSWSIDNIVITAVKYN